jgi:hypothetical protein
MIHTYVHAYIHTQNDEIQVTEEDTSGWWKGRRIIHTYIHTYIHTHTQNDEIQVTEEDTSGWWKGRRMIRGVVVGKEGWFPSNVVD